MNEIIVTGITQEEFLNSIEKIIEKTIIKIETSNETEQSNNDFLTRAETANYLKVSLTTLYNWSKTEKLLPIRLGKRVLYRKSDIHNQLLAS